MVSSALLLSIVLLERLKNDSTVIKCCGFSFFFIICIYLDIICKNIHCINNANPNYLLENWCYPSKLHYCTCFLWSKIIWITVSRGSQVLHCVKFLQLCGLQAHFFAQQGWIIILTGLLVILFRHLYKSYCLEQWLSLCVLIRLKIYFLTIVHWWSFQFPSPFLIKSVKNMPAWKLTEHENHENLAGILRMFYCEFSYGILN